LTTPMIWGRSTGALGLMGGSIAARR
jgi:hypothetical protein